ncbi:carotenoid biosynthesis protein [Nocardia arizonensis]|uniref:carotenoid biosynthesis protein n=1 Tax=Nocardia arizonensis TaxID=1141647 RepID=UPI0009E8D242|nr:carotenoid biosynthesis protein [Nocardia arizonensis]
MTILRSLTRFPVAAVCAALLIAVQICYPLTADAARDAVTVTVVLLSAATALTHAAATRGPLFAAGYLMIVYGLGLLAEAIGTTTGFPFGCYAYAVDRLGPALGGVPLIIALAWAGGLYPVWIVAGALTARHGSRIALTAVGAVGWDLYLDPQMVADGAWRWCSAAPGLPGLADVPVTNYAGWLAVGLGMAIFLDGWDHAVPRPDDTRTPVFRAATAVPIVVFCWTWLGSALAHAVFLGLPASACYGALGMGVLGVPLLIRLSRDRSTAHHVTAATPGENARGGTRKYPGRAAGRARPTARRPISRPSRGNSDASPGTM